MTAVDPQARRPMLDRAVVVETARQVALREGMAAVTMSGVARTLGVTPMALYRHVGDVDELVERVIDAIHAEIRLPDPIDGNEHLAQYVSVLRRVYFHYAQYRGLAEMLLAGGAAPTADGARIAEWFLRHYHQFGLDSRHAAVVYATFREFFLVSIIQRRQPIDEHRRPDRAADGEIPLRGIDDVTAEERFDFALEMFLRWADDNDLGGSGPVAGTDPN